MTGKQHSTPHPYHVQQRADPIRPSGVGTTAPTPQVNRFDRIDRHIHHLKWLVAINLVLSAALLVVVLMVLDG